jgi:hypothetical protein
LHDSSALYTPCLPIYLLTADIVLAFSLSAFPNFLHIFFIGALFLEFGFVVKSLLKHARNRNRKVRVPARTNTDAPPPGTIIHGAQNWEDEHEREAARAAGGLDLEELGAEEALKPVPPAYGVYRGSVRIADSDIRYLIPFPSFANWVVGFEARGCRNIGCMTCQMLYRRGQDDLHRMEE